MPPKLNRVLRLDSLPLNQTYYTEEGYLIDRPIVTSTGIFEYHNEDGSVRRELRLPEEVFDSKSLDSYKGRPIIITHDAGLVTKDNVHKNQIGTILTGGYRSGDDVRAEIIIHDTNEMKHAGLKELSLGYNLDLDETPGEWNGHRYDAIQRNIRINHLALVREARAGEQARLNIDSRDNTNTLKGEKVMSVKRTSRSDGILTPDELKIAVEEYLKRRAAKTDAEESEEIIPDTPAPVEEPVAEDADEEVVAVPVEEPAPEVPVAVEAEAEKTDAEEAPATLEEALKLIETKNNDMQNLFDIIDTMLAEQDFAASEAPAEAPVATDGEDEECATEEPEETEEVAEDGVDDDIPNTSDDEITEEPILKAVDSAEDDIPQSGKEDVTEEPILKTDSADYIIEERIRNGMLGRTLNIDGLEKRSVTSGRKAIVRAVRPKLNLDGKSRTYVNAVFDLAVEELEAKNKKGTDYQKKQMFNKDSATKAPETKSAMSARERMIARHKH